MNWSSGKDSAMALYQLLDQKEYCVDQLFTTVSLSTNRITMHGLQQKVLEKQAQLLNIPLEIAYLSESINMENYNQLMNQKISTFKLNGYDHCAYGDIFLEDLKIYREKQLEPLNVKAHFPLWGQNTKTLIDTFFALGFRAVIVAADSKWFDETFVGQEITPSLMNKLPSNVDPCGENGEFHTFCFDGPIFKKRVDYEIGKKIYKTYPSPSTEKEDVGFWFCDIEL